MAENKKSYVGYVDWGDTFDMLDDADAGKLIKHFYSYIRDESPVLNDKLLQIAFHPIKLQLKRDLGKWEDTKEEKSNSGKLGNLKRWHLDLYKQVVSKEITISQAEIIANDRTAIKTIAEDRTAIKQIANIAVTVNDTVTVNEIEEGIHPSKKCEEIIFSIEHCLVVALNDNRWVKANAATRTDLMAFNEMLEQRGVYQKNPGDYKTHYSNWVKTKFKTHVINTDFKTASTSPPLKRANFN